MLGPHLILPQDLSPVGNLCCFLLYRPLGTTRLLRTIKSDFRSLTIALSLSAPLTRGGRDVVQPRASQLVCFAGSSGAQAC